MQLGGLWPLGSAAIELVPGAQKPRVAHPLCNVLIQRAHTNIRPGLNGVRLHRLEHEFNAAMARTHLRKDSLVDLSACNMKLFC